MKLTLLILFIAVIGTWAVESHAQSTRLTFKMEKSSIEEVLREIENQSEYRFFYNGIIDVNQLVSVDIKDMTVSDVLKDIFGGTHIQYKVMGRQIMLSNMEDVSVLITQQPHTVAGRVADSAGAALPGVTVVIKGTTSGTVTGVDGNYTLANVPADATLVFSFVGMKTQEISTSGKTSLDVVMAEESIGLEEVVAIGYGIQKRVNLTGSVSVVDTKDFEFRPQPNVQSMIQGKVPGLEISFNSGKPGGDLNPITIRGRGSFSDDGEKIGPLILIDGIEGNLTTLAPSDIESVSVLKDASSASIYGSRAANGVILVTTKKGKSGRTQISFSSKVGVQTPTKLSEQIWNSKEYMEMYNATRNRMLGYGMANAFSNYPQSYIDKYADPNRDKNLYPDYNWIEESYHPGTLTENQLGISGGTDRVIFNVSLGYLSQEGVLDRYNYERISSLQNIEIKANDRIKVGLKGNIYYGKAEEPIFGINDFMLTLQMAAPMFKPYLPDGSGRYAIAAVPFNNVVPGFTPFGTNFNNNPRQIQDMTFNNTDTWHLSEQAYFIIDILQSDKIKLIWNGNAGFKYTNLLQRQHGPQVAPQYAYLPNSEYVSGGSPNTYALIKSPALLPGNVNNDRKNVYTVVFTTLDYTWQINDKNELSAMAGFQEENNYTRTLSASRQVYTSDALVEIDGGSTSIQTTGGGITQFNMRSFFGRLNYSFNNRYLLEGNIRYDGTSRISKDYRWGVFPSLSAAWRLSEESFIKDNFSWITNFKIRSSYGTLGNSQIGNYPYQPVYDIGADYVFAGKPQSSVVRNDLTDQSLQWETTSILDIGTDLMLGDGLFGLTFDWYDKITDGILSTATIPMSIGMGAPTINYGKMRNRGFEIEATHQHQIGNFSYGINGMISVNRNKVLELVATDVSGNYIYQVGQPYGEHYLFVMDGLFQSEEEVTSYSAQPGGSQVHAGDIKLVDFTPEDHKVTKEDDRKVVGGVYPKMLYSFGINASYSNFDLSMFFQGVAGRKLYVVDFGVDPFLFGAPPDVKFRDAWTPTNTDTDVPALYFNNYGNTNKRNAASTYTLYDASYLRLKSMQLGYNIPVKFTRKAKIDFLRIYLAGENLLTWTPYPSYDPERGSDGGRFAWFPQLKTYSIGLNIKF